MKTAVVIPCYNEEKRLKTESYLKFLQYGNDIHLIFVNDGSTDNTKAKLNAIQSLNPERCSVLNFDRNKGKAEAVRQGILKAFAQGFSLIGFWDADLSTPLETIPDFCNLLSQKPDLLMVFGSRVQMLGKIIERSPARHYTGRFFATIVSTALNLKIYDSQCGAKMFRAIPEIKEIFAMPFLTQWIFDVEIIARWMQLEKIRNLPPADQVIYEYPLPEWRHAADSKIDLWDLPRIISELNRFFTHYIIK